MSGKDSEQEWEEQVSELAQELYSEAGGQGDYMDLRREDIWFEKAEELLKRRLNLT